MIHRDRSVHVVSWGRRFLFQPGQLETRVSSLSGGERARIVLARMMLQPADLLVLDEPTNDLDIPALEVLEEALLEFPGALVLEVDRNMHYHGGSLFESRDHWAYFGGHYTEERRFEAPLPRIWGRTAFLTIYRRLPDR